MKELFDRWVSRERRLDRKGYILAFVLPFVALVAASWLTWTNWHSTPSQVLPVLIMAWLALFCVADGLNVRRYHDLGNSGRLYLLLRPGVVLLPLIAFGLEYVLPAQAAMAGDTQALMMVIGRELGGAPVSLAPPILLGITAVGVIGNVLFLALMPGQAGPNAYGPDPRSGAGVSGAAGAGPLAASGEDPVERALREYQQRALEGVGGIAPRTPAPRASASPALSNRSSGATFGKKR